MKGICGCTKLLTTIHSELVEDKIVLMRLEFYNIVEVDMEGYLSFHMVGGLGQVSQGA